MSAGVQNEQLPRGWRRARLGEVTKIIGGSTPSSTNLSFWGGNNIWITPTDLGKLRSREIIDSERGITNEGFESAAINMLPVGSVVMSSRAPIGHLGIAAVPLCTNQGCKSFVSRGDLDARFLYWILKYEMPSITALGTGNTFPEVSKSKLAEIQVSMPSLSEQRRIADLLDAAIVQQANARAAAREMADSIENVRADVFARLLGAGEWPTKPLIEVCRGKGQYGLSLKAHREPRGTPMLRMETFRAADWIGVISPTSMWTRQLLQNMRSNRATFSLTELTVQSLLGRAL